MLYLDPGSRSKLFRLFSHAEDPAAGVVGLTGFLKNLANLSGDQELINSALTLPSRNSCKRPSTASGNGCCSQVSCHKRKEPATYPHKHASRRKRLASFSNAIDRQPRVTPRTCTAQSGSANDRPMPTFIHYAAAIPQRFVRSASRLNLIGDLILILSLVIA